MRTPSLLRTWNRLLRWVCLNFCYIVLCFTQYYDKLKFYGGRLDSKQYDQISNWKQYYLQGYLPEKIASLIVTDRQTDTANKASGPALPMVPCRDRAVSYSMLQDMLNGMQFSLLLYRYLKDTRSQVRLQHYTISLVSTTGNS